MATRIMQEVILDALDELSSSHTSTARKGRALDSLEKLMAEICGSAPAEPYPLQYFIALQDTFQCNIPSRLLAWISDTTYRLEALSDKGFVEAGREAEVQTMSGQLAQGLNVIQGIALQHTASKGFLGRRYAQETLLDLLLVSRHIPPISTKSTSSTSNAVNADPLGNPKKAKTDEIHLTAIVLDTLLCILVDSSPALRMFEEASGVQYVVRILKRAGTPREVRMKCLEFLYFYLMDETTPSTLAAIHVTSDSDLVPTAPNSPVKPSSRSTTQSSISSDGSSSSSSYSASSRSSSFSTSTLATSFSESSFDGTSTPKESQSPFGTASSKSSSTSPFPPTSRSSSRGPATPSAAKPRPFMMLKKDLDFVPLSPKKAQVTKLGLGVPRIPSKQREVFSSEDNTDPDEVKSSPLPSPTKSSWPPPDALSPQKPKIPSGSPRPGHRRGQSSLDIPEKAVPIRPPVVSTSRPASSRTMEEKKEILGSLLGNVEALVEGVRKAGVWGLG